jgi:hypothetical protein
MHGYYLNFFYRLLERAVQEGAPVVHSITLPVLVQDDKFYEELRTAT